MNNKVQFLYDNFKLAIYIPIELYNAYNLHKFDSVKIINKYPLDILRIINVDYIFYFNMSEWEDTSIKIIKNKYDSSAVNYGHYNVNDIHITFDINVNDCNKWIYLENIKLYFNNALIDDSQKLSEKEYKFMFKHFVDQFKKYQKQYDKIKNNSIKIF